jgi:hypothetical protein
MANESDQDLRNCIRSLVGVIQSAKSTASPVAEAQVCDPYTAIHTPPARLVSH